MIVSKNQGFTHTKSHIFVVILSRVLQKALSDD